MSDAGSRARTHPRRSDGEEYASPSDSEAITTLAKTLGGVCQRFPPALASCASSPRPLAALLAIVAVPLAASSPSSVRSCSCCVGAGDRRLRLSSAGAFPRWRRCATTGLRRSPRSPARTAASAPSTSSSVARWWTRRTLAGARAQRLPGRGGRGLLPPRGAGLLRHAARRRSRRSGPAAHLTGASTITQQACRNLAPHPGAQAVAGRCASGFSRPRMERALTKDQILNLYLNHIYFGHSRYGVEEAALFYFGKHAKELVVARGRGARRHRAAARAHQPGHQRRQGQEAPARTCCSQMVKHGFSLRSAERRRRWTSPSCWRPRPPPPVGLYYVEEIRRMLVARYGEAAVLDGGLQGGHRHGPEAPGAGRRGPPGGPRDAGPPDGLPGCAGRRSTPTRFASSRTLLEQRIAESGRRERDEHAASRTCSASSAEAPAPEDGGARARWSPAEGGVPTSRRERGAGPSGAARPRSRRACVSAATSPTVDDATRAATAGLRRADGARSSFSTVGWARPRGRGQVDAGARPKLSDVLSRGPAGAGARAQCDPAAQAARGDARPGAGGAGGADRHRPGHPPRAWR